MQKHILLLTITILILITACKKDSATADIALHPLFTDGMVLQQSSEVTLWGTANTGRDITVESSWEATAQTTSDEEGNWSAVISTPEAGGSYQINVISGQDTQSIMDVLIGEVWLASGQSNMEMPLSGWPPRDTILKSAREIAQADYSEIRMFTVARNYTTTPIDSVSGEWQRATSENVADFSATAYFFAERLHNSLNVPVGIIHSSWGGTVAEAWTSAEKLGTLGDFDETLATLHDPSIQEAVDAWFGSLTSIPIPTTEEDWQSIDLQDEAFLKGNVSDDIYESVTLPGAIDQFKSGNYDGVVWLKKTFTIEDADQDLSLQIGAIDDMDATYINGEKVGGFEVPGFYNAERSFEVPNGILREGENTIAIRVIDTGGGGSVSGPIVLSSPGGATLNLEGEWQLRTIAEIKDGRFYLYPPETDFDQRPNLRQFNQNTPTALYNAMIHPLVPYQLAGAIWYQGESNVSRAEQYQELFPAMITDWRERWGEDFPFYFVQIAPYNYGNDLSPNLRDAQRLSLETPNTGMVVTLDIGNPENIHPANKQDVGRRLAGLALKNDYGQDLVASGPLFRGVSFQGAMASITFDHTGSGLIAKDGLLTGFELAGEDKVFVSAVAKIVDDKVEVFSPGLSTPAYVRYAYTDVSTASLYNQEGLPASSFSSETGK
ncbi:MAG TPA: sialate O-acetylesterase [Saprospiraceae bacterium]|nr:sialate O-acetylesterase [Saprospiraceae bacterium]